MLLPDFSYVISKEGVVVNSDVDEVHFVKNANIFRIVYVDEVLCRH